jgi:hypothetical protein
MNLAFLAQKHFFDLVLLGEFLKNHPYYGDNNSPAKPNMHARLKTMQKETSTMTKRTSGRQQDSKKIFKNLKAGYLREGRELRKGEVKQEQRQE